ncbi:hypothetical protein MLD38_035874 [Melastoma candidum]|uniref:Uncharacterized protein n=1 Tax=Melastoma candidum TaxID=119954 RepID=A0ACB9LHX6_9MYRT|nr:hypothetical protein MLD38_035874 [Melastoma candidum]
MVLKRPLREERSDHLGVLSPELKRRAKHLGRSVFGGFQVDEIISRLQPWLETFFRDMVGEEVDRVISLLHNPSARSALKLSGNSGRCSLQLRFGNELPDVLYSGSPIEADGGTPLQIKLVDSTTGETVVDGPLSSLKVQIVVVGSGFGCDDEQEDWSLEEFNQNIVRERQGRKPLLAGEINLTLKEGVGVLGNLVFTDNSSWNRTKKFRLGVRVVSKSSADTRVREAVSSAFSVKEHRGQKYRKHHPPSLDDEVWRLEQIRKDGTFHERLSSQGIVTVKDFLRLYEVDPSALRNIFGPTITTRTWDIIVAHAKHCVVDDNKHYTYYFESENIGLMFNSVFKVVAVAIHNLDYQPMDSLTSHEKALVHSLKIQALKKTGEWLPFDSVLEGTVNLQDEPSINFAALHQGQKEVFPASNILSVSNNHDAMWNLQSEVYHFPDNTYPVHSFDTGQDSYFQGESGYNSQTASAENFPQCYQSCPSLPGSSTWGGEQGFFVSSGLNSSYSSLTSLKPEAST